MLNRRTDAVSSTRLLFVTLVGLTLSACGSDDFARFTLAYSVAAGDLNGDGRPDLASGTTFIAAPPPHPGHVSVMLQSQASPGSFGTATRLAAGSDTVEVAIGDLNDDDLMDVVTANFSSATISVFLQNASSPGTFQPATHLGVGAHPEGVAIGDLNGDGHPDLAVADSGLSILLQDIAAPGTFSSRTSLGVNCSSVAIGDLNADGRPDLVATAPNPGYVSIHLQDSTTAGNFLTPQRVAAGLQPIDVAIADLNGDGFPDFAVANYGAPDNPATASLSVFLNDVAVPGTFSRGATSIVRVGARALSLLSLGISIPTDSRISQ